MCNIKDTKQRQRLIFEINPTFDKLQELYSKYNNNIQKWYSDNK